MARNRRNTKIKKAFATALALIIVGVAGKQGRRHSAHRYNAEASRAMFVT